MKRLLTIALAWFCLAANRSAAEESTWIAIGSDVYGAQADKAGPIGGGEGYMRTVTQGDYVAKDLDALIDALSKAKPGQIVFIPGETEIDLTARIYIEQLVLEVPPGVTLAGDRGHKGSHGALLTSDALKTPVMIRAGGPDVRITGLANPRPQSQALPRPPPPSLRSRRRRTRVLLQVPHLERHRDSPPAAGGRQLRDLRPSRTPASH